jgi:RNA polymerase sigma factor (sigma-70 family)
MRRSGRYSDDQLLQALRSAQPPDWAVRQLYIDCFKMTSSFVLKNNGTMQDAEDIFQEAVVNLIEMTSDGTFRAESSISSFIYALTRNLWLNELRRRGRAQKREKAYDDALPDTQMDPVSLLGQRELKTKILTLIDGLGEICKTILLGFYYEELSIREILTKVDYQNEQVLRNKKSKCMKQLVESLTADKTLLNYLKSAFHA